MEDQGGQSRELKYCAFISYSHADSAAAASLQTRLERYVLPQALRTIRPGLKREVRPLRPIFRDADELVPGQDLPARVQAGLMASQFLLVVCSPSAAASAWVEKEILDFCALGRSDSILAIVVDGVPNAEAERRDAALECLPRALRFHPRITSEGKAEITDRRAVLLRSRSDAVGRHSQLSVAEKSPCPINGAIPHLARISP